MNRLGDFDFHDAEMRLKSYDGNTLVISVKNLNIHKNTPQNGSDSDMELAETVMTFSGVSTLSYETDDDPAVILTGDQAASRFLKELKAGLFVFSLEEETPRQIVMDGCGDSPYFAARFAYDSVRVEWDAYRKKAWYELHRYYKREICLATPEGEQKTKLEIYCHDEDVYDVREDKMQAAPLVTVHLRYRDQEYRGMGSDDYWNDAFADLQKHLPPGVALKCCLTCRHGNLCPVGNNIDELFCTEDVSITQKNDLYFYTEDNAQREKRRRSSTDLCGKFQPQSEGYYTYNDYLYYLNR